nr:MAG TPA: structural protein [Caudoviricetes sp.]
MKISKFHEKLNKIDGNIYVVEEKVELQGGVYDAPLQHDNINTSTLSVYTGPKLTGERIQTYTLSTPSLTPWKRTIRIYAGVPTVYISYEAEGDTVEAEDVNLLQEELVRTQEAVNAEIIRAGEAEKDIAAGLTEEITRAKTAEQTIAGNLTTEISRAKGAEQTLSGNLTTEVTRAKAAEKVNADNLTAETTRAKAAENTLTENLSAEKTRALAAEESIRGTIQSNKPGWDDKYTRNEVDNKFATLENAIDWKESVGTYADIAITYPDPQDGWTVNVKDTDYTYRYSGTAWVVISANAIPKATQSVDGLLTKEDKALYDDSNSKKHTHSNKTTIDKLTETLLARWNDAYEKRHEHENKGILDAITQALLDNWSAAFTHISDAVKHITVTERTNWNDANSKKHAHSNKSILDGITQPLVDRWNAAHTHVSDTVRHVAAEEREAWNTVSDKVNTVPGKGLSTNDYTNAEKNKLAGIAAGAEVNVQADWNVTDSASDAYLKNKPASLPASDVAAWAKAASKPSYKWSEVSEKPTSFPPSNHTHTKSQISDMPTKVSGFENDSGYLTAADIDTSQNHAHANKSVLDKITQALLDHWNAAYTHVSNKSNPHGVTAAQVGAAATAHTHVKADIADFPASLPANGGNAATVGGHTVNADVPTGAKFTDTVYTHPNSGVTAGAYKSVNVNAQGHVTGGSNPTTLAGYGITDAAAKSHNHDSAYLKKTGLTWDDLKGV